MSANFKTISQGINLVPQSSDPSGGAIGDLFYNSTYKGFRFYDGTTWKSVGSGAGGGSKNYLSAITTSNGLNTGNGDAETGDTTGWSLANSVLTNNFPSTKLTPGVAYANSYSVFTVTAANATAGAVYTNNGNSFTVVATISSATTLVCTGTGIVSGGTLTLSSGTGDATITYSARWITNAAAALSFTSTTSNKLAGSYSFQYESTAATTAGDMFVSNAFYIDNEDRSKMMTIQFAYYCVSDSGFINWSGTSSNSFGVAIYDVTNGEWIQPTGVWGMTTGNGYGTLTASFPSTYNSTQYQLAVYNANATSGAVTVNFDSLVVSPQTTSLGAVVTDWVAYTPTFTGFGTPTSVTFQSRRVGDTLEVHGIFVTGTTTATGANVTLGFNGSNGNVVVDTSKIPAGAVIGIATFNTSSATTFGAYMLAPSSNSNTALFAIQTSTENATTQAQGSIFNSSMLVEVSFSVPIVGWTSNSQMSSSLPTGPVVCSGSLSANQSIANNTNVTVQFNSTSIDTVGAFNTSNYTYTVATSGYYDIFVSLEYALNATDERAAYILVNGAIKVQGAVQGTTAATVNAVAKTIYYLKAGDTISFQTLQNSGASLNLAADQGTYFTISMLPNTSTVLASPTVMARYTDASGQSVGTSAAILKFGTKQFDTGGNYNTSTGLFTCPSSGKYKIVSKITLNTVNLPVNLYAYHNGAQYSELGYMPAISGVNSRAAGSDVIECVAGDTLAVWAVSNSATTLDPNSVFNYVIFERIGE